MRERAIRPREGETLDAFYHGRIGVLQAKKGYRFSVDAPLLADFIRTGPDDEALELGTGSGVISLLLSVKPFKRITAIEIQEGLAGLARRNVELNGLGGRIEIVRADWRAFDPGRTYDLVFSNPPYIKRSTGFLSVSPEKAAAKHELHGGTVELLKKTAELLGPRGRACFVYPEKRREELLSAAGERGLAVRRLRFVKPRAADPPNLFLVEFGRGAEASMPPGAGPGGAGAPRDDETAELMSPLVLFGPDGRYTPGAEAVFAGP